MCSHCERLVLTWKVRKLFLLSSFLSSFILEFLRPLEILRGSLRAGGKYLCSLTEGAREIKLLLVLLTN